MATRTHEITFRANPTQKRFIESRAEADLFDCRKGEGKSAAIAWSVYHHTRFNPGAEWLIIRDTWENCRRTTQREFFTWFPPGVIGEYKSGDKEFLWRAERLGLRGRVTFIGLDDERDAGKVASMPLGGFAIDEPAPAAADNSKGVSEFIFDTAFAQLRQPGMSWYPVKLAQNNPDEGHWTYRRFWDPGTPNLRPPEQMPPEQTPGFKAWQTGEPENTRNLPPGYYEGLAKLWAARPDLVRRFVEGKHGFQRLGKSVTPEWVDVMHLAPQLEPIKGVPLQLLYDGGLNPTCIITQVTPLGDWFILEAHVGEEMGMYELITDVVKPRLVTRFAPWANAAKRGKVAWRHIGDPALNQREQSSVVRSAARVIQRELGGVFVSGPVGEDEGTEPLRAVLRRQSEGRGTLVVDRVRARAVWHSLRGGWHRRELPGGAVGSVVKNIHSHPGDAMRYGAAVLFPLGRLQKRGGVKAPEAPGWFNAGETRRRRVSVPREARVLP